MRTPWFRHGLATVAVLAALTPSAEAHTHSPLEGARRVAHCNCGVSGSQAASTLNLPLDFTDLPIADGYDLIGYDPRGIGRSSRITCLTAAEIADNCGSTRATGQPPTSRASRQTPRPPPRPCADRSGDLLRYVTTDQIVRDWDLIRALLGEPKLNLLAFSAGTWFGAHYASQFPHRVGRMVLDSNTEFTATMQTVVDNQPPAFERRFTDDFLAWIARHEATYHYGRTAGQARARWEARRAALPTLVSDTFTLQPADLDNITIGLLYHKE
jgi:pimeloyl-ACP methyl ester carboxylesterase